MTESESVALPLGDAALYSHSKAFIIIPNKGVFVKSFLNEFLFSMLFYPFSSEFLFLLHCKERGSSSLYNFFVFGFILEY